MALIVQVDWNGDGDWGDANEDVTQLLIGPVQTFTGRETDTLLGYAGPGQFRATLDNRTGIFSPFNTTGALFGNLKPGRMVRVLEGATVLWIGRLTKIQPFSSPEAAPTAVIEAEGILAEAANMKIPPLTTAGGETTGTLIAAALTDAGLVTAGIDTGEVTTGPYGTADSELVPLLDQLRKLEDAELGFLHEDVASYRLLFHDRAHRPALTTPLAVFSDGASPPLRYTGVEEEDWVGHIYNRAIAGVSAFEVGTQAVLTTLPGPYTLNPAGSQDLIAAYSEKPVLTWNGHLRDIYYGGTVPVYQSVTASGSASTASTHNFTLSATITPNDLLLMFILTTQSITTGPSGFTQKFNASLSATCHLYVYARNADGTEDGASVSITLSSAVNAHYAQRTLRFTNWHGNVSQIEVSLAATGTGTTVDAPSITPSWGALAEYFIAFYVHETTSGGTPTAPAGYTDVSTAGTNGSANFMNITRRAESTGVTSENPAAWGALFSSETWFAYTLAFRGARNLSANVAGATPNTPDGAFTISYDGALGGGVGTQEHENIRISGTPLEEIGESFVQADYAASQDADDGVGVRTYPKTPAIFENITDAETYVDLIVARYGEAVPVMSLTYRADIDSTHLAQAIARKVGDRITLTADNSMMLGVDEDFFIESVSRVIDANEHYVTYTLSPASVTDE